MEKITKSGSGFHQFKKEADPFLFPELFTNYLKSFGDIYFWEKGNFHVVTKALHARDVLKSADYTADRGSFFISRMPNLDLSLVQDFFGVVKNMMVMSDDLDHQRRRKIAAAGFEDIVLEKFKDKIEQTVTALVGDIKDQDSFEFVEKVSRKLPSIVLADLFCIPESDREDFFLWSNTMTGFFGGASAYTNEEGIAVNNAAKSLKKYFQNLVEERSNSSEEGSDYVSIVIRENKEMGLSLDEVTSQLIMMLVAGMATTTDQVNNNMFQLAKHQNIQAMIREDFSLIPQALEEFNRFDPAVTFIFRVAKNDTMIGSQPIKKGEVIFISTHLINRDLPIETKPDELNIFRKASHFAYGYGAHYCIGAKLAKLEMNALFEALLKHTKTLKIDNDKSIERDHYSLSFSGFKTLNLKNN